MTCKCVCVLIMSSATETTQSIQGWEICFLHRWCPHKTFCGVFGAAAQFHWRGLPGVSRSYRVCFGAARGCWRVSMVFQINQLNHVGRWLSVAWYSQFTCQCHFLWQAEGAGQGSTSPVSPCSSPPLLQTSDGQILSCLHLPATVVPFHLHIMHCSRDTVTMRVHCSCVALAMRVPPQSYDLCNSCRKTANPILSKSKVCSMTRLKSCSGKRKGVSMTNNFSKPCLRCGVRDMSKQLITWIELKIACGHCTSGLQRVQ